MSEVTVSAATTAGRLVRRWDGDGFMPYDPYDGQAVKGLSWIPLEFDAEKGIGSFYLRFAPGARSRPHRHSYDEHFYMLDGEMIEPDGTLLRAGDHVFYPAGTAHSSQSPGGCTMLVWLKGWNIPQDQPDQEN